MPTHWIEKPGHERIEEYRLHFTCKVHPSSGMGFACDSKGNLIADDYCTLAERQNQLAATLADPAYAKPFVMNLSRDYFNPGTLRCHCGREHHLARGDSDCECGQIYNACGQELKPRDQWEENYEED